VAAPKTKVRAARVANSAEGVSSSGKYLTNPMPSPRFPIEASNWEADTMATASPTTELEYSRDVTIQKRKPNSEVNAMFPNR
jgi:hypothetical protein